MNEWLVCAGVLLLTLVPCAIVCFRSPPSDRLAALELATTIDALIFLVLAQALGRDIYFDLAIAVAVLSLAGGIVFAHFMERWV